MNTQNDQSRPLSETDAEQASGGHVYWTGLDIFNERANKEHADRIARGQPGLPSIAREGKGKELWATIKGWFD